MPIWWERLIEDFKMNALKTKHIESIFLKFKFFEKTLKIMKMKSKTYFYLFILILKHILNHKMGTQIVENTFFELFIVSII